MRRAVLLVIFVLCSGLPLIGLLGLAMVWFGEVHALIPPNATNVRINQPSLTRQHITYQLPPNVTLADLSAQLVQDGWTHDVPGERALKHDQMGNDALMLFWRHSWLGLVPEVVTVRLGVSGRGLADIQLSRCFTIQAWMRCQ
jgi:hypothetical protein